MTEHNDSCATVDVTYSLFYPFNYGKVREKKHKNKELRYGYFQDVCVGIDTGGLCLGEVKTFGIFNTTTNTIIESGLNFLNTNLLLERGIV